jgi:protein tyrosine phosphatase
MFGDMSITNPIAGTTQSQPPSFPYTQINVERISSFQEPDASQRVREAEQGFRDRWDLFGAPQEPFPLWSNLWDERALEICFKKLNQCRLDAYVENAKEYDPDRKVLLIRRASFSLRKELQDREQKADYYPISFDYNRASDLYNASIINIHGLQFIAMEAPSTGILLNEFFHILNTYNVSTLVCLTPPIEHARVQCIPYWEEPITRTRIENKLMLQGEKSISFVYTDAWKDNQGIGPNQLFQLVMQTREGNKKADSIIAAHCAGGRGRTGTFIAAYVIAHDLDEYFAKGGDITQIPISIDKLVWELSLQRGFAVSRLEQYVTLHEFVGHYLSNRLSGNAR